MRSVRVERLDHLGIGAGMCREIGLAEYLDTVAGPSQQQVSVGAATVAMILNGLGFSNRRLYLVSQFFATKPVDYLLGPGITAEQLHDDCLGRHWTGSTTMTPQHCLPGSPARRGSALGSWHARSMWIRPRLPSAGSTRRSRTRTPSR
jgi:uncharacterized protein DUF4277